MPLESATYISSLVESNPAPTDQLRQSDDHIRMIKAALLASFPNITGPVTTSLAHLNSLFRPSIGEVKLWWGSAASVPAGWAVCDGTTKVRSDGGGNITLPDLRGKVAVGVDGTHALGAAFGAATDTATSDSQGAHTHTTGGHTHSVAATGTSGSSSAGAVSNTTTMVDSTGALVSVVNTVTQATTAHTHSLSVSGTTSSSDAGTTASGGAHTHDTVVDLYQPSLALYYIMFY